MQQLSYYLLAQAKQPNFSQLMLNLLFPNRLIQRKSVAQSKWIQTTALNTVINLAKKMKSKPGEGIAGRVFLDGEPLLVNKASDREEFDARDKYKSKSYVSLPIYKGRNIIGVLNLTEKEEGLYSKGEIDLLKFVSDAVALKLQGIESN